MIPSWYVRSCVNGLIAAIAFLTSFSARSDTFHGIFLADTNDASIGRSVIVSSRQIVSQLNELCDYAGVQKDFVALRGNDLVPERVSGWLDNLNVSSGDVVFFHYDGHGCSGTEEWPRLVFAQTTLDLSGIVSQLRSKNPRLLVVLADCCNAFSGVVLPRAQVRARVSDETIRKGARKLLVDSAGIVMACAASKGEFAYCNEAQGSLFTEAFAENLYWETRKASPSWYDLAIGQVQVNAETVQHPHNEMDVRRLGRIPETEVLGGLDLQGYVEQKYGGGKVVLQQLNAYGWRALVPVRKKLSETLELRTNDTYDLDMGEVARRQYGEDALVSYRSFEDPCSWFVFRER